MGNIMIMNASPRAPKSNSKQYARIFSENCHMQTEYFNLTKTNHMELAHTMERFSDVLFVFPLYVVGIPVTLLNFLKALENSPPQHKPVVSVLINCGFLEPEQNSIAVKMIQLYCRNYGYPIGSVLKIGGGEAILTTPFRFLVKGKIKKLARSITSANYRELRVTMPLPKSIFIKAASTYWENYGKRNGITKEDMKTMQIEA